MTITTRNLSHKKLMLVEEKQVIARGIHEGLTVARVSASIISNSTFAARLIEKFGFWKGKEGILKSSKGMKHVLSNLAAAKHTVFK